MRAFGSSLTRGWWQHCRIVALCIVVCVAMFGGVLLTFQQQWERLGLIGPWFSFAFLPLFVVIAIGVQARLQERADMMGGPKPIQRDAES